MERIKFIIDSSSDITKEEAETYDIEVVPMGVNIDGEAYLEGVDFTREEFYDIVYTAKELPTTNAVNPTTWYEVFEKYAQAEEYDRIVVSTVGSPLSSTYSAAVQASKRIAEDYPQRNLIFNIYDSESASSGYSYPMMQAVEMHRNGKTFAEIDEYLLDWYASFEVFFVAFSFDIVKKSGRVNAPTAYIGEKLNIRPVMILLNGKFIPYAKVRGDKNVPPKMLEYAKARMRAGSPYLILNGTQPDVCEKTMELMEKEFGYKVANIRKPGPAMVANAGPKMFCFGFLGERRK